MFGLSGWFQTRIEKEQMKLKKGVWRKTITPVF